MGQGSPRLTWNPPSPRPPPHNPRPLDPTSTWAFASLSPGPAPEARRDAVSDVLEVIDPTTIRLADAAAAAVVNAEVYLNRPDSVALTNYARRDVKDLTVDLGDAQ